MSLHVPSIDQGVQAFAWAVFFFFVLWIGMLAVDVSNATALILLAPRERRDLPVCAPAGRGSPRAADDALTGQRSD